MLSPFYPGVRYLRANALIGEDERPWAEPVVRSGQPICITIRAVRFHPDTKARRESSRRVRGLEYLRDHDEELRRDGR